MFDSIKTKIVNCIGKIHWKTKKVLTDAEKQHIRELLKDNYYIIVTRHDGSLSSYAIAASHLVLTKFKKIVYYAHVLMNTEDFVATDDDFRFIEAVRAGVKYSSFYDVFDYQCSSVALLKPKSMTIEDWTLALDKAKSYLGRDYDTLYNLLDDTKLSCVELIRDALRADPDYNKNFACFESMIKDATNLDPHMFYECHDFEVVYEVRH